MNMTIQSIPSLPALKRSTFLVYTYTNYPYFRLADKGHDVVGCEGVDLGCREFFEEQNIPYKTEPIKGIEGLLYKVSTAAQR